MSPYLDCIELIGKRWNATKGAHTIANEERVGNIRANPRHTLLRRDVVSLAEYLYKPLHEDLHKSKSIICHRDSQHFICDIRKQHLRHSEKGQCSRRQNNRSGEGEAG